MVTMVTSARSYYSTTVQYSAYSKLVLSYLSARRILIDGLSVVCQEKLTRYIKN
jgi:hypothetical protein